MKAKTHFRNGRQGLLATLFLALPLAAVQQIHAGTLYWDGAESVANGGSDNATTSGQGWLGGGNWDDGTLSAARSVWTPGDSAVFGGSAASQTVTAGSITVGNLTFGSGALGDGSSGTAYTVSGGNITFAVNLRAA